MAERFSWFMICQNPRNSSRSPQWREDPPDRYVNEETPQLLDIDTSLGGRPIFFGHIGWLMLCWCFRECDYVEEFTLAISRIQVRKVSGLQENKTKIRKRNCLTEYLGKIDPTVV